MRTMLIRVKQAFRSISTQIAVLLVLLLVPLNVVSVMVTSQYGQALEEQARHSILNTTTLYLNDLQNKALSATKYLAKQMISDQYFITLLKQQGDSGYTLAKNILSREFTEISEQQYAGDVFFFYSPKLNDVLVSRRRSFSFSNRSAAEWLRENVDDTYGPYWKLVEIESSLYAVHSLKSYDMYFGTFISLDSFQNDLPRMLGYSSCRVIIDNQPVLESNELSVTNNARNIDLFVHVLVDRAEIQTGMTPVQRVQKSFTLIYLALVPVLLLILQFLLVHPLQHVSNALIKFSGGESTYRIHSHAPAHEFEVLQSSYNNMADHIEQLKIVNYEQQMVKKEIELKNLQLTIRPHFLQNTLGLLYTMSQTGEMQKTGDFILYLSSYFRSIYQGLDALIPFSQELSLIRSYIEIAKLQYPGGIQFDDAISNEALYVRVPSLLVHNFVENSISHAYTKNKMLHIHLTAEVLDNYMHISLSDDGMGIPMDVLARINAGEMVTDGNRVHMGLYNTYHRLQIIYKGMAILAIQSHLGEGTTVDVHIPTEEAS